MFILLCWKRGRVFTAVTIMVPLSWKTSFQLSNDLFIVGYSSFPSITKSLSRDRKYEKLFLFSFQNFDKVDVINKLNSIKSNCRTYMRRMTLNKLLPNNGPMYCCHFLNKKLLISMSVELRNGGCVLNLEYS